MTPDLTRISASVITVGTELTSGLRADTNGPEIALALTSAGLDVSEVTAVPDRAEEVATAISDALSRCALVVVTGGLGPTHDDITREAASAATGRVLVRSDELITRLAPLAARHTEREAEHMALRQADVLDGARVLPASVGTAPGQILDLGTARLVLLPGPPHEMRPMLRVLLNLYPGAGRTRVIRTAGASESDVQVRVMRVLHDAPDVRFTVLASPGLVDVVLADEGAGCNALDAHSDAVCAALGRDVYAEGDASLAGVVIDLARSAGVRLACAESCTGGLVASELTSEPGSSDVFLGGIVAYANDVKTVMLGVPPDILAAHGAVSAETAVAMADGARGVMGAELAVSTTGVAGPSGGSEAKPIGTVFLAVSGPDGTVTHERHFIGDRTAVRTRATLAALDLLRRALTDPTWDLSSPPCARS